MSEEIDIATIPCCPENFEPLFKLGLCFEAKRKIEESIKCYQRCIRIRDNDRKVWQCLGQAYFARGSFVNANKCFIRSIQLRTQSEDKEKSFYEEIRIGDIKMLLNNFDEASSVYQEVISEDADNILALLGLAKIELISASDLFEKQENQQALVRCDEVLSTARKVCSLQPDLIQPLNLIINCCILIYQHSTTDVVTFPQLGKTLTRLEVLKIAERHLLKALSLKEMSYLWYHLFIISSLLYSETGDQVYLQKSSMCLEKCKK